MRDRHRCVPQRGQIGCPDAVARPTAIVADAEVERTSIPGVVPGLAWTSFGGDVLFVEATAMPGGRGFQVTGSVGNVMQESARAALSYVRSRASTLGISYEFFEKFEGYGFSRLEILVALSDLVGEEFAAVSGAPRLH